MKQLKSLFMVLAITASASIATADYIDCDMPLESDPAPFTWEDNSGNSGSMSLGGGGHWYIFDMYNMEY